ncbi:MAG TPA: DUF5714 domain-containing protein [Anaeromyxobacteraceae bacterium]|nr:DUF5714 domain-containing protein [Anaeromyxobacteraceae bacterium]
MSAGAAAEHATGCLVCGAELAYATEASPATCAVCGVVEPSPARCRDGHYVCNPCHSGSAADVIERACREHRGTDPVALATALMRHPAVKMHGPEHHFLVPAALLAAWASASPDPVDRAVLLAEARRRASTVVGGSCGFHGACGSGVGVGIFASLATGSTPRSRESWGRVNQATGRALQVIGGVGGPRCCKRTTWLALLSGIRFAREELGVRLEGRGPRCEFHRRNDDCLERDCPFYA